MPRLVSFRLRVGRLALILLLGGGCASAAPAQDKPDGARPAGTASSATAPRPAASRAAAPSRRAGTPAVKASGATAVPELAKPLQLAYVEPELPAGFDPMGQTSATVVVTFTIQPDGTIGSPVVSSTTHRRLSRPTLSAISQWRFEPLQSAQEHTAVFRFEFDQPARP